MLRTALLVLLLAACGGRTTQAPSSSEPSRSRADITAAERSEEHPQEQVVLLFEGLARDLAQAGAACPRTATVLTTWTENQRTGYAVLVEQAAAQELPAEQLARYEDRLAAALTVIVDSALECKTHGEAQTAFRAFDEIIDDSRASN